MSTYNIDISNKNKTIHNIPLSFKCKEVKYNTYLAIFYRMSSFFIFLCVNLDLYF